MKIDRTKDDCQTTRMFIAIVVHCERFKFRIFPGCLASSQAWCFVCGELDLETTAYSITNRGIARLSRQPLWLWNMTRVFEAWKSKQERYTKTNATEKIPA